MRRLFRRFALVAAVLVLPPALLVMLPAAGYAGEEPVLTPQGTLCWERRAPADNYFTVILSDLYFEDVSFYVSTEDGSATAKEDFEAIRDLLVTIPKGTLSVRVPLTIRADEMVEKDEVFYVRLYKPSAGTIKPEKVEIVIMDGAPPKPPR
jgi:hypothetical protein